MGDPVERHTTEEMNESRTISGSGQLQNPEEKRVWDCFRRVTNTVSQARSLNKFSVHHVTCTYSPNANRWSVHIAQVVSQLSVQVDSVS